MSCYVVVDGRSLAVSRNELQSLTDALPNSKLALDVRTSRARQAVTVTITEDRSERAAIQNAAAAIREERALSPTVFVMQELERLLADRPVA